MDLTSKDHSISFIRQTLTPTILAAICFLYFGANALASVSDRAGSTTSFSYDALHNLTGITGPNGAEPIENSYDPATGRLAATTDSYGNKTTYSYDLSVKTETIEDFTASDLVHPAHESVLTYDSYGNVLTKTQDLLNSDGSVGAAYTTTSQFHDPNNNPDKATQVTDPMGRTSLYAYDPNSGNLTGVQRLHLPTPTGNLDYVTTSSKYNAFAQLLTTKDALGNITAANAYDAYGNLTSTTDVLGHVTAFTYNPDGTVATTKDALGHTTGYGYDAYGDVTSVTDALGHSTSFAYDVMGNKLSQTTTRSDALTGGVDTITAQFAYDGQGRLVQTTAPDGSTSVTVYNDLGKVDHTVDALGRVTAYVYDSQSRLTQTAYPDGTTSRVTYDLGSRRTSSTDRAGRATTYAYDSLDRLLSSTEHGTAGTAVTTASTFDPDGETTAETDANGHTTRYFYDDLGRKTSTTDALGHVVEQATYDDDGRELTSTDANGNVTSYVYDNAGKLLTTNYADGTSSTTAYDDLGRRVSSTDQADLTTSFTYDALGRLLTVTSPMGPTHVETYAYDELGEKVSQTDANHHVTSFAYDVKGHLIQKTLPSGGTNALAYNADGSLASETDFNGQTVSMSYDAAGRLTGKAVPYGHGGQNSVLAISYNADGSVARKTKYAYSVGIHGGTLTSTVTTTYAYDDLGRTSSVTNSNSGAGGITSQVSYTYDAAGNKKTQTTGSGTLTYDYDQDGRLKAVHQGADDTDSSIIASYGYDNAGNRKGLSRANGVGTVYTYDSLNRLTGIANTKGGAVVSSFQYVLGPSGKRVSVTDNTGAVTTYAYDADGRLTEETGAAVGDVQYAYDPVGNRMSKSVNGVVVQSFTYDSNDRVTSGGYSYDHDGNITFDGVHDYNWDWESKLTEVDDDASGYPIGTYLYTPDGLRVQQNVLTIPTKFTSATTTTTNYTLDPDSGFGDVVEERDGSGSLTARYDYGDDMVRLDRASGEYYYLYDGLGSVRNLTDASGNVADSDSYDAFGNLLAGSNTTGLSSFLYDGQQQDATGLYYLRARYMDPARGEFESQDSYVGDDEEPISLHKYLYAGDDGVNFSDPGGNDFVETLSSIGGALIVAAIQYGPTISLLGQVATVGALAYGVINPQFGQQFANAAGALPGGPSTLASSLFAEAIGLLEAGGTSLLSSFGGSASLADGITVYRGVPAVDLEDVFENGLATKGNNLNVRQVISSNSANSGYIHTSSDPVIATDFASNNSTRALGYVLKISTNRPCINVNEFLGEDAINYYPEQKEILIPGGVVSGEIEGAYPVIKGVRSNQFISNPNFGGGN